MADTAPLKDQLRSYFNGIGFERWSAIYGDSELSSVRRTIRAGHDAMLAQAESWLRQRFAVPATGTTALDAGCGTGLFSLALARMGFTVAAVDIAPQMAAAAQARLRQAGFAEQATCSAADLETVDGQFSVVACFDVLIHYPAEGFESLCTHLARRCDDTLLLTYAPYSPLLATLHRIGGYFPKSQRRTEIQMIRDAQVHATLRAAGMTITRQARISKGFYHVALVEASRK
ncbi:MAG: magnesium protoporphyrin IX methyltransferase [Chloroflexaceae bacterium]|nr:magnesium protoporphyrin IX methyltransferase [Chloroflexaceae bacterium]